MDGKGHASYTGGGILARLDVTESLLRGLYVEGSFRWTRLYGDDAMVALDRYEFDTVDSQRLRVGARLDWQFSASACVYVGAAWEHEFNGEARATTYGIETPAPQASGKTALFPRSVCVWFAFSKSELKML